jgi:hypothetical protein
VKVSTGVAQAAPASNGEGPTVPVRIEWKEGKWGDRKLLDLEARLHVTGSDDSSAEVKKQLDVHGTSDTLLLRLATGVSAKRYVLELVGRCQFKDENGQERIELSKARSAGAF